MVIELGGAYLWVKGLHVVSVIAWMAGLFYLPRLYVYHAEKGPDHPTSETFKVMERRLLKAITTPAAIASLVFGVLLLLNQPYLWSQGWWHMKLLGIVALLVVHGMLIKARSDFLHDRNRRSGKFYRILNEVPTLAMLAIVFGVIVKPF